MVSILLHRNVSNLRVLVHTLSTLVHLPAQIAPPPAVSLQIIVCANHLSREEDVRSVMRHEIIHAYDHCRAKDLDWNSCRHHACSEIRAAVLSGDCTFR